MDNFAKFIKMVEVMCATTPVDEFNRDYVPYGTVDDLMAMALRIPPEAIPEWGNAYIEFKQYVRSGLDMHRPKWLP